MIVFGSIYTANRITAKNMTVCSIMRGAATEDSMISADAINDREMTMDCKWMQDEICVNADCPMRADFCPVPDIPGVCRFEEREERNEQS